MTMYKRENLASQNIRDHNLSEVLRMIRRNGAMSRADISRQTGLSATTISSLANILLTSGLVSEVGEAVSSGGRPPILMQFEYEARYAIGVDLGASHMTSVILDMGGRPLVTRNSFFPSMNDPLGSLEELRKQLNELVEESGVSIKDVLGIGVGAPAPLEGENLEMLSPIILPAWKEIDLAQEIHRQFKQLPVYIDNDANVGALAEKWWGKGRGYSNMAYIKLGTGVGSGLIINDDIFRGSAGTAGEIGHTSISSDGPLCRCGNQGCLEAYVGTPAIHANAAIRLKSHTIPGVDPNDIHVRDLARAAMAGDPAAAQIVRETGNYLGIALANLLNLINPGLIVLGGDLVIAGPLLLSAVEETAKSRAIAKAGQEVTIMASDLGEDVVAIGGATLVFHHAFQPSMVASILNL